VLSKKGVEGFNFNDLQDLADPQKLQGYVKEVLEYLYERQSKINNLRNAFFKERLEKLNELSLSEPKEEEQTEDNKPKPASIKSLQTNINAANALIEKFNSFSEAIKGYADINNIIEEDLKLLPSKYKREIRKKIQGKLNITDVFKSLEHYYFQQQNIINQNQEELDSLSGDSKSLTLSEILSKEIDLKLFDVEQFSDAEQLQSRLLKELDSICQQNKSNIKKITSELEKIRETNSEYQFITEDKDLITTRTLVKEIDTDEENNHWQFKLPKFFNEIQGHALYDHITTIIFGSKYHHKDKIFDGIQDVPAELLNYNLQQTFHDVIDFSHDCNITGADL